MPPSHMHFFQSGELWNYQCVIVKDMLDGSCVVQLKCSVSHGKGCLESILLFQLLELLETCKEDTKSNCFYRASEDDRINSS